MTSLAKYSAIIFFLPSCGGEPFISTEYSHEQNTDGGVNIVSMGGMGGTENDAGTNPATGGGGGDAGSAGITNAGGEGGSSGTAFGGSAGFDSGGGSAGSSSGGTNVGGTGGTDCVPRDCDTLTFELRQNVEPNDAYNCLLNGDCSSTYNACGQIADGCGGFVDCGGCADKPFAEAYSSCGEETSLCEAECIEVTDLLKSFGFPPCTDSQFSQLRHAIQCNYQDTAPIEGCVFDAGVWCCPLISN